MLGKASEGGKLKRGHQPRDEKTEKVNGSKQQVLWHTGACAFLACPIFFWVLFLLLGWTALGGVQDALSVLGGGCVFRLVHLLG